MSVLTRVIEDEKTMQNRNHRGSNLKNFILGTQKIRKGDKRKNALTGHSSVKGKQKEKKKKEKGGSA